ncbi:peptide chain release factor N(5)-glutamine methyltransferase [Roseomonas terrae]|jgi:release factor glutamine methyltransferase|uniref:Release factor glutamine methyltransferase n=1 Tax=Neoroseomonas terrae TaxID=424799 RepID=A0ABS5EPT7_9PROT|nr:peptide chain release factor N(5)-glutamine methyltransferase [Neoroseomonas terrae]MBR0652985.1 peptide chain release factor N(5)-glutamine methyltransferase [Neoroseomonas terrae]
MTACADPGGSVGAFLCQAGQVLRAAGVEGPRQEARMLLAHAMACREEDLLRDPRVLVPQPAVTAFASLLRRRAAREPMAHLLGRAGFWTLTLETSPVTLVPRGDSEAVVEAALSAFDASGRIGRVLDLGTGTGALLLAVLAECPEATGVGIDLNPAAAALAARNAATNGLAGRAAFLCGDWAEAIAGRFDLVLSNPPYIETAAVPLLMPEVARFEPALALDGGSDGLDAYRRLTRVLPMLLTPGGRAVLEIGQGQRPSVEALARAAGLKPVSARQDLGGIDRALVLRAD